MGSSGVTLDRVEDQVNIRISRVAWDMHDVEVVEGVT
jgi:hypothetical protein